MADRSELVAEYNRLFAAELKAFQTFKDAPTGPEEDRALDAWDEAFGAFKEFTDEHAHELLDLNAMRVA